MPYTIVFRSTMTTPNHAATIPNASKTLDGLMSKEDKAKLDALGTPPSGAVETAEPVSGDGTGEDPITIEAGAVGGNLIAKNVLTGAFTTRSVRGRDGSGNIAIANVPAGSQVIAALYNDNNGDLANGIEALFDGIITVANMLHQTVEQDLRDVRFVLIIVRHAAAGE